MIFGFEVLKFVIFTSRSEITTQKQNPVSKAFRYAFFALFILVVVYVSVEVVCGKQVQRISQLRAINRELIIQEDSLRIQIEVRKELIYKLDDSIKKLSHERIKKTIQQAD